MAGKLDDIEEHIHLFPDIEDDILSSKMDMIFDSVIYDSEKLGSDFNSTLELYTFAYCFVLTPMAFICAYFNGEMESGFAGVFYRSTEDGNILELIKPLISASIFSIV